MKKIVSLIMAVVMCLSVVVIGSTVSVGAKSNADCITMRVKEQNKTLVYNGSKKMITYNSNSAMKTWFYYNCRKNNRSKLNVNWLPSNATTKNVIKITNNKKENIVYVQFNNKVKDNKTYQIKAVANNQVVFKINLFHKTLQGITNFKLNKINQNKDLKISYNKKNDFEMSTIKIYTKDNNYYSMYSSNKKVNVNFNSLPLFAGDKVTDVYKISVTAYKTINGIKYYSKPIIKNIKW